MPNPEWDDFALTQEFKAIDKRLELHDDSLKGLSHFPTDVAIAAREIEHLTQEIQAVAATCTGFHEEWQKSMESRQKGRTAIVVAVVTGCFTVLAAMVVLIASLVGAG